MAAQTDSALPGSGCEGILGAPLTAGDGSALTWTLSGAGLASRHGVDPR